MSHEELKQGTWLLAFSGGGDSAALFHKMRRAGIVFACAHVNYHLRPHADAEEAFVRQLCREYGIVCHVKNTGFAADGNLEASAREFRYAFFEQLVKEYGYAGIVTGHQEDDLLETYLMQKEKDLVPETYGIAERSVYHGIPLIRPLLSCTKRELEEYCRANGYAWQTDESNADPSFTRNRIRRDTVAGMDAEQRRKMKAEIAAENRRLRQIRSEAHTVLKNGRAALAEYRELAEEVRLILLYEMYAEQGLRGYSRKYFRETDEVIRKKNDFLIPVRDHWLACAKTHFFLMPAREAYAVRYDRPVCDKQRDYIVAEEGSPVQAVWIREEDCPFIIRSPREGDAIRMRFGTKKLSRFFIDRHIPLYRRKTWPVVENAQGTVILVPGLGCDIDHYSTKDPVYVLQYDTMEDMTHVGKE